MATAGAVGVAAQQVDGPMSVGYSRRTRVRPTSMRVRAGGQELLEVRLDAVLLQAGVDAELVGDVVKHLVDA